MKLHPPTQPQIWPILVFAAVLIWTAAGRSAPNSSAPQAPAHGRVQASANPSDAPLPPQEATKHMTLPEGFSATLFAGEPDVAQPIALTTDDQGRLWVAECFAYPTWAPVGNDQILIFQDRQNAGHFDQRKVFWDKGNYLTGLEVGFGGVWACCAPNLLFIPKRAGDDAPAGEPVVELDGWSNKGVHNVVNGLAWGPDGWLYGCNGITAPSTVGRPGTPAAQRTPINCGVWRYHPTRHLFEVVANGTTNPWGIDFDDYGQMFITNCVIGHLWHVLPGAHYKRMFGEDFDPHLYDLIEACSDHLHWGGGDWTSSRGGKGIHSEAGGGHAHCGVLVYLGDTWPERYRNTVLMCNIHGNRLNNDLLQPSGSGYVGKHGQDFLLANDPWFRGVALKSAPDGGIFVSDWCDTGECHNFKAVDRTNGRIYKVNYQNPQSVPLTPFDLSTLSDAELVKLQLHKNDWYVRHARRILQERAAAGNDMTAAHRALVDMFKSNPDATRKLRALWALDVTDGLSPDFLVDQLGHENEHVRGWAVRLLCEDKNPPAAALAHFTKMAAGDPSPIVRLELASALQRMPLEARWPIAAGLAAHGEDATDHNLPLMIWYGIEPAVAADALHGLQLAAGSKIPLVRRFIARRVTESRPETVVEALRASDDSAIMLDLLTGMYETLRGRRNEPMPAGWPGLYGKLAASSNSQIQSDAFVLALVFGDKEAEAALGRLLADTTTPAEKRHQSLQALVEARAANLAPTLHRLIRDPVVGREALRGLAVYDDADTPAVILRTYDKLDPAAKQDAIGTLASRPAYAAALLDAIEQGRIPNGDVSVFTVRQLQQFHNNQLNERIAKSWGAVRESTEDKKDQVLRYKALLTAAYLKGADPSHGRQVFTRTCMQCHTLYGVGAKIGPDLTGSNRANLDYILQKVVDPSAAVANDFKLSIVVLKDGRLISGIVREKTARTITVQTDTQRIVLAADDVEELKPSPLSMMPEGQFTKLTHPEIRDLISYLAGTSQVPLPEVKGAAPQAAK